MNHRISRPSLKTWFALGVFALGGACGGRAVTVEEGPPAAGAGNVGAGASGGTVSAGGSSGRGGAGGNIGKAGSSSVGGATSSGGGNGCDVACPPIACGSGSTLVFPNGACCPACLSNCAAQPCPFIPCPSGYQLQTQPDQCCPICVPSPATDCATGRQLYGTAQMAYAQKYQYGCTTAADCIADAEFNACESGCSYYPISLSALGYWQMNLAGEGARDCANCPPPLPLPCVPPPPVYCNGGQCSFDYRH